MGKWSLLPLVLLLGLAFALQPGQAIPDFALLDPQGRTVTAASMRKPAVIVFWASWCPVCREEFPGLHRIAEETGIPFYVISAEPRDTREVVLDYMRAYPRFLPLLASDRDRPQQVAARFRVLGHPWTFVVDAEGKVVALFAGRAGREALLDALLLAGADLP
ncbi:TlpA family protein disulfide reductase [Thermus thermamylovorans]|uniref:TlpA family protein disulfide reductase n=1 Tax=Thermus thermamylovorans TaxID=2509362 RepID=A0A4Q9B7G6_9DEIN|nr:TlpA disulfide reductase family protein [Thermus thermamylovorans]TBH20757.1 TlpA family protein disulfide reductase [Thermus thermamylovorans]